MWTVPGKTLVSLRVQQIRPQIGVFIRSEVSTKTRSKQQQMFKDDQQLYSSLIRIHPMGAANQAEDTALSPSAATAVDPLRSPKVLSRWASQR